MYVILEFSFKPETTYAMTLDLGRVFGNECNIFGNLFIHQHDSKKHE